MVSNQQNSVNKPKITFEEGLYHAGGFIPGMQDWFSIQN